MNEKIKLYGHYAIALAAMGCATALAITGHISGGDAIGVIGTSAGISIGAGAVAIGRGSSLPVTTTNQGTNGTGTAPTTA